MNHLEGGLLFAGIPIAVVLIVFVLVFATTERTQRDQPRTGPVIVPRKGVGQPRAATAKAAEPATATADREDSSPS